MQDKFYQLSKDYNVTEHYKLKLNEYINTSFSQIELLENLEKKYNKIKLSGLSKNDILNLNQTKEMYLLDIKNSISSIMLMLVNIKTSN